MPATLNLGKPCWTVDIAPDRDYDPAPDPRWRSGLAQHKSAKKRARQTIKRRARNRSVHSGVRTGVKSLRAAIESGDGEQTTAALRNAESLLRRAASKGVIPKKRASRHISRLARRAQQAPLA